jgi:hypothetical protein
MATDPVITYIRGTEYVKHWYQPKPDDEDFGDGKARFAYGLVGELWVGGLRFDTMERIGKINMQGDRDYQRSSMFFDTSRGYVINPSLDDEETNPKRANILFHAAGQPDELRGCVGVGYRLPQELAGGRTCLELIWRMCGGPDSTPKHPPSLTLKVRGRMRRVEECTPWSAFRLPPRPAMPGFALPPLGPLAAPPFGQMAASAFGAFR